MPSDVVYLGRRDAEMIRGIMDSILNLEKDFKPEAEGIELKGFKLGQKSLLRLGDLTPLAFRETVTLAITLSEVDFTVFEVLRTLTRQQEMVRTGMSRTMNSKHLPDAGGKSRAVDLVPWINGRAVWDWEGCYKIAHAMDQAATQLGCAAKIRWGGAWDRVLADFGGDLAAYRNEVELYKSRHPGKDFIDGPHFEWVA